MRAQLEKSNIKLTIEASADATIRGDPDQLKQVLLNLVRNAAESIGECGEISLRLRTERASLGGRLFRRRDPGSQRQRERHITRCAKAPFRSFLHDQASGYRSRTINCGAHRRTARGSSALQNRSWSRHNFRDHVAALHPMKNDILLVEDDSSLAASLRHVLELSGYGVTVAATGEAGRACAAKSGLPLY